MPQQMSMSYFRLFPDSAASHGLLIRRIEPDGENTRITLVDVDFAAMIGWIADLERSGGSTLEAIDVERRPAPGTVNARLTLRSGA